MKDDSKLKLLLWFLIACLIGILIGLVRSLNAQDQPPQRQCYPAEVNWKVDSLVVRSFGCADAKGDTLFLIQHIVNEEPKNVLMLRKQDIISIIFYEPKRIIKKSSA